MSENSQLNQTAVMINMASQVGCMMSGAAVLVIGLAFGAGYLLDRLFDTGNILTIIFLVGSFPVTLFAMIQIGLRMQMRMQKQLDAMKKQAQKEQLAQEEEKQT
ncbi:MAG: AtpZ/AtpI family protein [Ardenticatenaceae bacterium]|nr:AtpZ/AtpI family protein [Ardenticatenaceae bacterium]